MKYLTEHSRPPHKYSSQLSELSTRDSHLIHFSNTRHICLGVEASNEFNQNFCIFLVSFMAFFSTKQSIFRVSVSVNKTIFW